MLTEVLIISGWRATCWSPAISRPTITATHQGGAGGDPRRPIDRRRRRRRQREDDAAAPAPGRARARGEVIVAKSLSVDKDRTTIPTLITALFMTCRPTRSRRFQAKARSGSANCRARPAWPKAGRAIRGRGARPAWQTLVGLKRLMAVVADGGGCCRSFWSGIQTAQTICAGRPWRSRLSLGDFRV